MYQLFVDIHNFKQIQRISPELPQVIERDMNTIVALCGATTRNIAPGKNVIRFTLHRPSDTLFIVESAYRIYDFMQGIRDQIFGFSLMLEIAPDADDADRHIRQLMLTATQDECLWLGPQAAGALGSYLVMEHTGYLWKVLSRNNAGAQNVTISKDLMAAFSENERLSEFLTEALAGESPKTVLGVLGEAGDGVGDFVNHVINEIVGAAQPRPFLWIFGQNEHDSTPVALTRCIFPMEEKTVIEYFDESERGLWFEVRSFLFQNAYSPLQGVRPAVICQEYPLELFRKAWGLFLRALKRRCAKENIPFVVHIEDLHMFDESTVRVLEDSLSELDPITGTKTIVIYSGSQNEDIPQQVNEVLNFEALNWDKLEEQGIGLDKLPPALSFCKQLHVVPRRFATHIQFLQNRLTQKEGKEIKALPGLGTKPQRGKIERALVFMILQTCDELSLEVYYAILISYGLLPLPVIFDFLSSIDVERIRHPSIIQNLQNHGLIRDEELVIPSHPHASDDLEVLLGEKAEVIRSQLESFLAQRLKKGALSLRMDTFVLMADIANPEHFFDVCFVYAQELLDVRAFEDANYILDYASTRLQNMDDSPQKQRLMYAVAYLNCRSLLMQNKTAELQVAFSNLCQLAESTDLSIAAFMHLQKARMYIAQDDLDQSLAEIKRSVMLFQDIGDKMGLSSAQLLFGQILLGKERLIEAKDYFILARNNASSRGATYEDVRAGTHDLVVTFLLGFHSRVIETLDDPHGVYTIARHNGLYSHALFLEFLRGRSWFEIGSYFDAARSFELALETETTFSNPEARALLRRWLARCQVYSEKPDLAEELLQEQRESPEALFFLAESRVLNKRFEEAQVLLNDNLIRDNFANPVHPENILWNDGFANLENKIFVPGRRQGVLQNLFTCFRAYALSKTGAATEGAEIFGAFIRSQKRSVIDPANYMYHYLYSQVLAAGPDSLMDDFSTTLGKSVKFIQERSSRIEDPSHKVAFLRSSYWNRLLLQDARANNLA